MDAEVKRIVDLLRNSIEEARQRGNRSVLGDEMRAIYLEATINQAANELERLGAREVAA